MSSPQTHNTHGNPHIAKFGTPLAPNAQTPFGQIAPLPRSLAMPGDRQSEDNSRADSAQVPADIDDADDPALTPGFLKFECIPIDAQHVLASRIDSMSGAYLAAFVGEHAILFNRSWVVRHRSAGRGHEYRARYVFPSVETGVVETGGVFFQRSNALSWSNCELDGKCSGAIRNYVKRWNETPDQAGLITKLLVYALIHVANLENS